MNLNRPFSPPLKIQRSIFTLHTFTSPISPLPFTIFNLHRRLEFSLQAPIMSLKAATAIVLSNRKAECLSSLASSSVQVLKGSTPANNRLGLVAAASKNSQSRPLSGVVFEPFEEVKKELSLVPTVPQESLARHKYSVECEAAVNEQINVEYNVSYVYHAMYAYFDRDNVALKGLARFFKESSEEEREHAEKFMEYQNMRGGKVKLQSILMPVSEYDHVEKGDALYAMELVLSLEKLTSEKLLHLHKVATQNNDIQLSNFVETEFLTEQVESIKKISEYVAQLRRVGQGHGVWHFNQILLDEEAVV